MHILSLAEKKMLRIFWYLKLLLALNIVQCNFHYIKQKFRIKFDSEFFYFKLFRTN